MYAALYLSTKLYNLYAVMKERKVQDTRESWTRIVVEHDGSGSRLLRKKIHYFVEELIFIRMIVRWDVDIMVIKER